MIRKARLYWETARHLRAGQIAHRLMRPLQRLPGPVPPGVWRLAGGEPVPPVGDPRPAFDGRSFTFLNEARPFAGADRWNPGGASRLWRYQLHYFRCLGSIPAEQAETLLLDWLDGNPAGARPGWEPYPTAIRLREWLEWLLRHPDRPAGRRAEVVDSLARQAAALDAQLEYHLGGNHLLEDAVSLCWAGLRLEGPAAERWRRRGRALLRRETARQVLPDGSHDERSPMYQALLAEGLLRLVEVAGSSKASESDDIAKLAEEAGRRMAEALQKLAHPDGRIALFNDAAFGEAPDPADLAQRFGLSQDAGRGAWALPETGYYGWRDADGTYLAVDAGPVGPDDNPGHAHGDIFSFELSLRGRRVIVDGGVHDYEPGEMRRHCRSTRAHNTVEVGGEDQCEFWDAFRVARRGRPRDVAWEPAPGGFRLKGWHDGYRRLPGAPVHGRDFRWRAPGRLEMRDRVSAAREVTAAARLHVHPECEVALSGDRSASVAFAGGRLDISFDGPGRLELEDSWYCPEFGRRQANRAVAFRAGGREVGLGTVLQWS